MVVLFIFVACFLQCTLGFYNLKPLSYLELATTERNGVYSNSGLNLGTATDAAYDPANGIIYVVGATTHFMHVVDINDPTNPTVLFVHHFTIGEGIPRSVDVCGDHLAVALAAQSIGYEGHVRIYKTIKRGSGASDVVQDTYLTVGNSPKSLKYTADCRTLVVANEGTAGKDNNNVYTDPEGTISVIKEENVGNPVVKLADFNNYDIGAPGFSYNIRVPSLFIPVSTLKPQTRVSQDIEPDSITISKDGRTAWVTLQENNAIAEIDLNQVIVRKVTPLPKKDWSNKHIDTSDYDGGIHRNVYNGLLSLRQPGVIKSFEIGNSKFLFTGDEGAPKTFTNALHGFVWSDLTTGYSLRTSIDSSNPSLVENATHNAQLGRLQVSSIDGKSLFTNMFTHLEAFGGRGYSIWSSNDMASPVYDSDGTLEENMERFYKDVFNTDYASNIATYKGPENMRDSVSYKQGPQVTGLDIRDDNGTVFLVVGTKSSGILYLYTVDTTGGVPVPLYEAVMRAGKTDYPWNDLYTRKEIGDLYITDLGIITSAESPTKTPLLYVISTGSGSLSLYSIQQL